MDDVVVKTKNSDMLIADFEETIACLQSTSGRSTPTSASLVHP
jgi:hypothetical protein